MKDFISDEELKKQEAPDFIKDEEVEKSPEQYIISPLETMGKKFLDTATMGYGPNIIAGAKTKSLSNEKYAAERDLQREIIDRGTSENPIASTVGTGAGILGQIAAGAALPEVAALKGVSLGGKFIKNLGLMSGISALKNPGEVAGVVDPIQSEARIKNAIVDAPINVPIAGLGAVVGVQLDKYKKYKDLETVKTVGPTAKEIGIMQERGLNPGDHTKDLASYLKNNGIVDGFPDPGDIVQRSRKAADIHGKTVGTIIKEGSKQLKEVIPNALDEYNQELLWKIMKDKEGESKAAAAVMNKVDDIVNDVKFNEGNNGSVSLEGLHTIRQRIQDQIRNYQSALNPDIDSGPKIEMFKDAFGYFNKMMQDKLMLLNDGSNWASSLKIANRNYSLGSEVLSMARDNFNKTMAPSRNILTDIVGAATSPITKASSVLETPILNSKLANMSNATRSLVDSTITRGGSAVYQSIKRPETYTDIDFNKGFGLLNAPNRSPQGVATQLYQEAKANNVPPFIIDAQVKNSEVLKPTEKAKLRMQNIKDSK